jgi:hypothetical protein
MKKQSQVLYFFRMMLKGWKPRNTKVMDPALRLAWEAALALGDD